MQQKQDSFFLIIAKVTSFLLHLTCLIRIVLRNQKPIDEFEAEFIFRSFLHTGTGQDDMGNMFTKSFQDSINFSLRNSHSSHKQITYNVGNS